MFRRLLLAALFLISITPSIGTACSCVVSPDPCSQAWRSGTVIFLGTVTAKSPIENPDETVYLTPRSFAFRFQVTESFRGPAATGDEVVVYTGRGGGDCGYPFAVGSSYLVYAHSSKDRLSTGICSQTNPAVMVPAVVRQLRALKAGQRVDDLFGTIAIAPRGVRYDDLIETKPLSDIRVRVIGDRTPERSTATDEEGAYSFQSLPVDTYRVEVDLPEGMSSRQSNTRKTLNVKSSTEGVGCRIDQFARPDGRISGRVVDEAGSGLAGFVSIAPADPKEAEAASTRGGLPGYDTEDGRFTLSLLPPGRYRLRFNPKIDGQVSFNVPPAWSETVDIGFGQQIEDFRFKVSTIQNPPK